MSNEWGIISSHYLNAWGLAESIRTSGWKGRMVCLCQNREPAELMRLYGHGVEVWRRPKGMPLVDFLANGVPAGERKWVFFTDERSLEELSKAKDHPWLANTTFYPGPECQLDKILDRLSFYELVQTKALAYSPHTIPGEEDPWQVFNGPFFFRYRRTWVCGSKTPRICRINNCREWQAAVEAGRRLGYGAADWCYQEVLSLKPEDNVSVCGWHDAADPRYVVTRKVLQFPENVGNGDVCELVTGHSALVDMARKTLNELRYTGPFELEFVRDERRGLYCMIELNPRFWLQHPLASGNLGQVTVRRYLGLSGEAAPNGSAPQYWVNTSVALNRLMRGDVRVWRYLRDPRAILVPPISVTLRWLPRFSLNLAFRRLRRP